MRRPQYQRSGVSYRTLIENIAAWIRANEATGNPRDLAAARDELARYVRLYSAYQSNIVRNKR